ncbi:MAG: PaaI family thioesterase [Vulcanimicrobiaceae bacterium]
MTELANPIDDGFCIGCGLESTIGLKMRFAIAEDRSVTSALTIARPFQGWSDVVHGGIVALVLDEAMAHAAGAHGHLGVTAELNVRFRKAVTIATPLVVYGNVLWQRRNVFGLEATVCDASQRLLASATARFVSRGELAPGRVLGEPLGRARA